MNWNEHSELEGKHAILNPSSSATWLKYSAENNYEQLFRKCKSEYSATVGTIVHDYARKRIMYKLPINDYEKNSLIMELYQNYIPSYAFDVDQFYGTLVEYVNDAITFGMDPEVLLLYSENCFGTVDTISFYDGFLRIHDLKTGVTPAHMEQLEVYAALFCLEYKIKPGNINIELRIYQNSEIIWLEPNKEEIKEIMQRIIFNNKTLEAIEKEE